MTVMILVRLPLLHQTNLTIFSVPTGWIRRYPAQTPSNWNSSLDNPHRHLRHSNRSHHVHNRTSFHPFLTFESINRHTQLRHVQSKIEPHLKNTQYLLTRLICQSIETGSITAINMLLSLICYETFAGKNTSYVIWFGVTPFIFILPF